MKKRNLFAAALSITLLATAGPTFAQSEQPVVREATYHVLRYVKFKPGTKTRAVTIFRDYIAKADELAGTNSDQKALIFMTGEWDAVIVTAIGNNLDRLEFASDPEQRKWGAALAQVAGGPDKAMALMDELRGYIINESWQYAYEQD